MKRLLPFLTLISAVAAAHDAAAATLTGRMTAAMDVAPPKSLSVAVDAWACAPDGRIEDPTLRIGPEGVLADVVIRLVGSGEAPPYVAKATPEIDQKSCTFVPHVVVVAPGQDLKVKNSDAVLHNFHTLAKANRSVNQAQVKGKEDTFRFTTPEIIPVECDVHYWMSAVVVVAASAWTAVSAADGTFTIENLPPGDYTAELWHQRLGTKSVPVHVDETGAKLDLEWPAVKTAR
jgi:plastocyanin